MNMKNTILAAGILAAFAPVAQAEFSANMALTSDYVWRGVSQSAEDPAIQGGIDWSHESGFYAGLWGSNIEFAAAGSSANAEFDLYGGYAGELGNGLGYDLGFIAYNYPGAPSGTDFEELYVGLSYSYFSLTYSHAVGSQDFGNYLDLGFDYEFDNGVGLGLHYGDYSNPSDYNDYKISVSKSFGKFDWEVAYTDTTNIAEVSSGPFANDGRLAVTVGTSF